MKRGKETVALAKLPGLQQLKVLPESKHGMSEPHVLSLPNSERT